VAQDEMPIDRPRSSGFVLQKIDIASALEVLDSFLDEDEAEQRETYEYLKRALDETRVLHGERPLFPMSRVILLDRDRDLFLAALDAEEQPNPALRKAAQRLKRRSS
jgi:hypothetical protein